MSHAKNMDEMAYEGCVLAIQVVESLGYKIDVNAIFDVIEQLSHGAFGNATLLDSPLDEEMSFRKMQPNASEDEIRQHIDEFVKSRTRIEAANQWVAECIQRHRLSTES